MSMTSKLFIIAGAAATGAALTIHAIYTKVRR